MPGVEVQRRLGTPSAIVTDFQLALDPINAANTFMLPDLSGQIDHSGKYTRPELTLPAGFFIDKSVLDIGTAQVPNAFSFYLQPGKRFGREASHNHVFFGKLLSYTEAADDGQHETEVAVKPYEDSPALLGEVAMLQYMKQLGLPTLRLGGLLYA